MVRPAFRGVRRREGAMEGTLRGRKALERTGTDLSLQHRDAIERRKGKNGGWGRVFKNPCRACRARITLYSNSTRIIRNSFELGSKSNKF